MQLKKREKIFMAALLAALLLCIAVGLCIGKRIRGDEQQEKSHGDKAIAQEKTGEAGEKRDGEASDVIEFNGFYFLESYMTVAQTEAMESEIQDFLALDPAFRDVNEVACKEGAVSTENRLEFYCVLNDKDSTILRAVYDKKDKECLFWTEAATPQEMEREWKEKQEGNIQTKGWEEEGKLPAAWTHKEEGDVPPTLSGKESLEDKIPGEELERLEGDLLAFLEDEAEFRREIEIKKNMKDMDATVEFWGHFKTQRQDGKNLHAVYDKKEKNYKFAIQEEKDAQ